jgi:hypothetical protein
MSCALRGLAEFILGPREARTRGEAPQDEALFLRIINSILLC